MKRSPPGPMADIWPREIPGVTVPIDADIGFEIGESEEPPASASTEFQPGTAAEALRYMAEKAPDFADAQGRLDPTSSLVRSAVSLLRASNDWLDHHRTRPFEVRAGERVLRAVEEGSALLRDSFVIALRATATELACSTPSAQVSSSTNSAPDE
jgi:hypothetical protein